MSTELKVSANSNPTSVAGAISGVIRDGGEAELFAVGAGAVNQAVKAAAIARRMAGDLICRPDFFEAQINGDTKTGIRISVSTYK